MGLPRGHSIRLSPIRRIMCDFLDASRRVPLVAIERQMALGEVVAARAALPDRPSWFAIFLKAYALVSEQHPPLRQAFLSFPWPRLHQHVCNVAHVALARRIGDEDGVLGLQIRHPERWPLAKIDAHIRRARSEPVEQFADFRRALRLARLPSLLRRFVWWIALNVSGDLRAKYMGTFGITSVGALGVTLLHLLSPVTSTLTYGDFADDGSLVVRLFFDHRVLDGAGPAAALADLEKMLNGPILAELRGVHSQAA